MNSYFGEGNLGQAPELKDVTRDGEKTQVANLRVYFDRSVPVGDGEFEDRDGFWLDVEIWGNRAANIARLCQKGTRVAVNGVLLDDSYEKDGATVNKVAVRARSVYLVPTSKIESLNYRTDEAA